MLFDSVIQQISIGDATGLITAISALAGTGFVTSILTWISHHSKSQAIQDAVSKAEAADAKIEQVAQQVQTHGQQISTAITAATSLSPQLQRLLDEKDAQMKAATAEINNIKTQLNTLGSLVPSAQPLQPASPKPEPAT